MSNGGNPTFDSTLVRKLVLLNGKEKLRLTKEAEATAGELLRLFALEARNRASIEAECEMEGSNMGGESVGEGKAQIRADHITKIAAELLMDFS